MAASPIAVLSSTAVTKKSREALAGARERGVDRRDVALPVGRLGDRGFERRAVALGDDSEDRAVAALALEQRPEQAREQRVGAHDPALLVDGRDRHRRVVEEAHEAHFGRALRIVPLVARAVEHQRARGAGRRRRRRTRPCGTAAPARCGRRGS